MGAPLQKLLRLRCGLLVMLGKTAQAQGRPLYLAGLSYIRFNHYQVITLRYLSGLPSEKGRYYTIALSRTFGVQPRMEYISATCK